MSDRPLYRWLRNGRVMQLHTDAVRQATVDVIELGVDAAATLSEDDGGVARLLGYRAMRPRPPELTEILDRLATNPPGRSCPHLRVVR